MADAVSDVRFATSCGWGYLRLNEDGRPTLVLNKRAWTELASWATLAAQDCGADELAEMDLPVLVVTAEIEAEMGLQDGVIGERVQPGGKSS